VNPLEQLVDQMLCPGALLPENTVERDDVGMPRCRQCRKPVLIRFGMVSLHSRERHLKPLVKHDS
jgi:hypothetical protein